MANDEDGTGIDAPPVLPLKWLNVTVVVVVPVNEVHLIRAAALAGPANEIAPSVAAPATVTAVSIRAYEEEAT